MTFIRKHKWTLIVLCALVVLWTVMEVTQGLLTQYTSSLREQLPALRNQAQVEAIEAKIEFWQPINLFVSNFWGYLIYFFMALPLLTLLFKLEPWLTLAYYLLAHLCTYIFSCLIMGGGLEMVTAPLKQSGYMMLRGYLIWAICAIALHFWKGQKRKKSRHNKHNKKQPGHPGCFLSKNPYIEKGLYSSSICKNPRPVRGFLHLSRGQCGRMAARRPCKNSKKWPKATFSISSSREIFPSAFLFM